MSGLRKTAVDELLVLRENFWQVIVTALLISLGINFLSSAAIDKFLINRWIVLVFGFVLVVGGCLYLLTKILPIKHQHFKFSGLIPTTADGTKVIPILRYVFSEQMARYQKALNAENKVLSPIWAASLCRVRTSNAKNGNASSPKNVGANNSQKEKSAKLVKEAVEYFFWSVLSSHLADHFENTPDINSQRIIKLGRKDLPHILLENHFLDLFTKPMDEREAFVTGSERPGCCQIIRHDAERPDEEGVVVWSTTADGALYDRFELTLPAKSDISYLQNDTIKISTDRFTIKVCVTHQGCSAVFPQFFENLYMWKHTRDVSASKVYLDVEVDFSALAFFSTSGWEYYRWVDSFLSDLEKKFSFKHFEEAIGWQTAVSTAMAIRHSKEPPPLKTATAGQPKTLTQTQANSSQAD